MARPTLRTVADKLGVSTATVSLAMRDSKKISSDTRVRVKAALAEAGYVYQRSAAGLRTSKTHTVGVIVNNVSDPFFSTLLASLEEALARAGRTVFLCNTGESVARQTDFILRSLFPERPRQSATTTRSRSGSARVCSEQGLCRDGIFR